MVLGAGIAAQLGCAEILGLQDHPIDDGGDMTCQPGSAEQCSYSGPPGTNGVGACRAAERTCNDDGTAWAPCQGEVTPKPEACETAADDNCDGTANEAEAGCACIPGEQKACYSGPPATANVGLCTGGQQTCAADGLGFGPCVGEILPAVEDCSARGDEDCSGWPCSDTLWSSIHGDEVNQLPRDVAIDAEGNIYVVGSFSGSLMFGGTTLISSGSDIFLVKLGPDGAPLWAKRFGDSNFQLAQEIAIDEAGNILMTGQFETKIDLGGGPLSDGGAGGVHWFVAKLSPSGEHLWSKPLLDSDYVYVHDVAADPEGDVLLTGTVNGTVDFGGASVTSVSGSDAFVTKLQGGDGTALWAKPFGGAGYQFGAQIMADVSANIVLVGGFGGSISFDMDTYTAGAGETRLFLARLDPTGGPFFSMEASGDFKLPSIAVDPAGNVLFAAAFTGSIDFGGGMLTATGAFDVALAKINVAGNTTVLKQIGGSSLTNAGEPDEFLASVGTDGKGDITLVTRASGTVDFGGGTLGTAGVPSIFVGKVTAGGEHLWSKKFGPVAELGVCFSDTSQDGTQALACGEMVPALDLGNGPLSGSGEMDVLVARLSP